MENDTGKMMIYLHLPTFYTHCPLNMAKCWKTWRHPPVLQCGNCSNAPFKIDFIWFPNDLKLRFFFDFGIFQPRLMTPTARMSFIPRLVWTQVLQMHLSSTGGAMPHCSGAHGFLIVLRIRNDDDQKQREKTLRDSRWNPGPSQKYGQNMRICE